jgi:DnaA family protein
MTAPQQLTLAIENPHEQRLDNFVAGDNGELLQLLKNTSPAFSGYWIFGALSSGCSHLLRGSCLRAQDLKWTTNYIGCADYAHDIDGLAAALNHASRHGRLIAVDNVSAVSGHADLEELLMAVYQRLLHEQGTLLISHTKPAQTLDFVTPDLASRMRSLQHFQIQTLNDEHKRELLRQRAHNRGYDLSHPVLDYWLARGPRDMGALLTDLDVLDRASLAQKQRVTIPMLKQVLGY